MKSVGRSAMPTTTSKPRKEGGEMATEGEEAQTEYVPVWLTPYQWATVVDALGTAFYAGIGPDPMPGDLEVLDSAQKTMGDAIEWAENH